MEAVVKFGKHKGLTFDQVPISYLTWYVTNIATPSAEVVAELERRSQLLGSRDCVTACAALAALRHRQTANTSSHRRSKRRLLRRNRRGA
jgi:hypothetical protein